MQNYTTKTTKKSNSYSHLNISDRETICLMLFNNETQQEIADALGKNQTTISRELKRNKPTVNNYSYRFWPAQIRAENRWCHTHLKTRIKSIEIRNYIHSKILKGWSPEIIAGRLMIDRPGCKTNHETIYQYIYSVRPDLIKYLPFSHRVRRKRASSKNKRINRIHNRVLISERPSSVNLRKKIGHWEGDTAVSRKSKSCLHILVERKTRYSKLSILSRNTGLENRKTINHRIGMLKKSLRKSLTLDNGLENVEHQKMNLKVFFCNPYHSWEKGTVEQVIGLVRRYLPKGTDFKRVSKKTISRIEYLLNNRPRKCLSFKTPAEIYAIEN